MSANLIKTSFGAREKFPELAINDWERRAQRAAKSAEVLINRRERALRANRTPYAERLMAIIQRHLLSAQILNRKAEGRLSYHA